MKRVLLQTPLQPALVIAIVASGMMSLALARAQPPRAQDSIAPASQLELSRLLDLASQRLSLRIDYDPSILKGQVTLRLPDAISDAELWALTNQLLAQRGFTTVRAPGAQTLSVVRAADAPQLARLESGTFGGSDAMVGGAGFASLVIAPTRRSAKELADSVRPLLTKGIGTATPLGDSRLLVISDFAPRLLEIQSLLDRLDSPVAAMAVEEIVVRNVPPAALATSVMQVAQKRDQLAGEKPMGEVVASPSGTGVVLISPEAFAAGWRELISKFDQRESVESRNYVPRVFPARDVARLVEESIAGAPSADGGDGRWRLVVDELTGTLMVTATASQHAQIAALVERLDATEGGSSPMRSFPIRNRPVGEMLATLSQLIDAGVLGSGDEAGARDAVRSGGAQRRLRSFGDAGTSSSAGAQPAVSTTAVDPAREGTAMQESSRSTAPTLLRLTADEATNTLIAIGEPRQLSQLETLLQMLDVRQPQVMLEAVLVSMTDTDALNLGIELEKLGNIGDAAYKIASLFGLSTSANGARSVADSTGFTGAVLNPGEFNVVVKALQAINKGRSLSNPKVLVTNNEQARFSSVLEQPFVRTDTTSNTATSSFGGSDSAGTTISVRPQIAQGDHLVLTYSINLSSFVGTPAAAGLPPPKQQNSVDSVATIPDGHVVVVGGLDLESESTSTSQIPLLGDVPLVGELFKSRSVGKSRTRFFVFIRASVLRHNNFEDLKFISAEDAATMRVPDGWPEVEPRVIR
jgi:type II secretory pathway component GspD/PulD (secretin)